MKSRNVDESFHLKSSFHRYEGHGVPWYFDRFFGHEKGELARRYQESLIIPEFLLRPHMGIFKLWRDVDFPPDLQSDGVAVDCIIS